MREGEGERERKIARKRKNEKWSNMHTQTMHPGIHLCMLRNKACWAENAYSIALWVMILFC